MLLIADTSEMVSLTRQCVLLILCGFSPENSEMLVMALTEVEWPEKRAVAKERAALWNCSCSNLRTR